MDGLLFGGGFGLLALFLIGKGVLMKAAEARLLPRLVAVSGRVTDPGTNPGYSSIGRSDPAGGPDIREREYEGRWAYDVAGRTYEGKVIRASPVFRREELPPAVITVFYDPTNPAVSRLSNRVSDGYGTAYIIFGLVVATVGALIALIPNLDWLIAGRN